MQEDVELLKQYVKTPYEVINKRSELTKFCDASSVWQWSNEPLAYYYDRDLIDKKVLTIIAGGDHILHAALGGAKDITAFDVNRFSRYYADLKIAMVKNYDYSTFWKNAKVLSQDGIKNISVLNPVIKTLPDEHQQFFEVIEKAFYDIKNNPKHVERLGIHLLTEYSYGNTHKYAYGKFDDYMLLKDKINDINVKYNNYMLEELPYKLRDKYDIIYASNIIGRMDKPEDAIFVLNELYYLLNNGGVIYDYALDYDDGFNYYLLEKGLKFEDLLPYQREDKEMLHDSINFGILYKYKK